jgi:pyruvate dehydrogenase E1 component beta subunit
MYLKNRKLPYSLAINEALHQMMELDKSVFIIGQGVKSPWYVGNTCKGLLEKFGSERIIDTPVSENVITGCAVGAAITGMRSIVVHPRMDFMMYAMDPIVNEAANWFYMNGGQLSVPIVIWGVINRGGEQAAQHSQAIHGIFAHVPGLKVVMPSTPYDAKGLMVSAIKDDNPVVFIDDRWLYPIEENVPEEIYSVPIGKGIIRKRGKDITVVTVSYMAFQSIKTVERLEKDGISAEVIDLRSIKPLDTEIILKSVGKTGRLVICDVGWKSFGISAEVAAVISEKGCCLKSPIVRVALPDIPAPSSRILEKAYYPDENDIIGAVKKVMEK